MPLGRPPALPLTPGGNGLPGPRPRLARFAAFWLFSAIVAWRASEPWQSNHTLIAGSVNSQGQGAIRGYLSGLRGPRLLLQVPRAARHERPVAGRRQRARWRALARFLARTQLGVGDDASKVLSPNATPESRALGSEVVELCENDGYHNNHHPKAVESGAS
jgi:hypothetical protein